jgi:hypothetical protein
MIDYFGNYCGKLLKCLTGFDQNVKYIFDNVAGGVYICDQG